MDNQDVKEKRTRTRRWTVSDDSDEPLSTKELAKRYGNMALEFDMIQQEMQLLQKEQLDYYRDVVGCEMATIQFLSKVLYLVFTVFSSVLFFFLFCFLH